MTTTSPPPPAHAQQPHGVKPGKTRQPRSGNRGTSPPPLHEAPLRQRLGVDKERNMVGPLARNVHEAGTQPLLDQAETSAHAQRTLILRAHAHLNPVQAELPNHQIKDERSNQGTQASSRPIRHDPVAQHPR